MKRQPKLHTPAKTTTGTTWCGPFALGAITGKTYEQACRALNRAEGKKQTAKVRGVWTRYMITALKKWGWSVERVYTQNPVRKMVGAGHHMRRINQNPVTLGDWIDNHRGAYRYDLLLIVAGHHFQLVCGSRFIDNHQQTPVNTDKAHSRRYVVREVYRVTRNRKA